MRRPASARPRAHLRTRVCALKACDGGKNRRRRTRAGFHEGNLPLTMRQTLTTNSTASERGKHRYIASTATQLTTTVRLPNRQLPLLRKQPSAATLLV
jgi:hypothetical protein